MKRYVYKILFALVIMGWSSSMYAQGYSGGDGSIGDPYQISTFADLQYLSETPGDWGYNFVQIANLDASVTSDPGYNSGEGFSPIGNVVDGLFTGSFDGQNHTISNLYINRPTTDFVGLFGITEYVTVIISNLGLLNVNISGMNNVGAVAGFGCQVENCYSTGNVDGLDVVGGVVGYLASGSKSYSTCNVTGVNNVGGFSGIIMYGSLYNCYATGNVSGNAEVGGMIGWNETSEIKWCYSIGVVTGITDVGGLLGYNNTGVIENCFWDTETSGMTASAGGTGKTTAEMKRVGTYLSDPSLFIPWDFTLTGNIWGFNGTDNNGYPFLRTEGHSPGNIWLGISSIDPTDWALADNWSENALPVSGDTVFIPHVLNDPILSVLAVMTDMTIETGGFLTVASTGQLTISGVLKNDAGNAGLVIDPDASLLNGSASVPGTVKREIASDGKWHFLSCPIKQTTMPEICDGNFAPVVTDFPSANTTYDFFYWQEPPETSNLNWINLKKLDGNPNTSITYDFGDPPRFVSGKGYLVEYFGTYPNIFQGDVMKSFVGELGAGSMSVSVTNSISGMWSGFNLIGNVYPSSIDWKAVSGWDRTVLENYSGGGGGGGKAFWIWNDASGNYGVYDSGLTGDGGTNGVSRYIPPTQAFFVKAATGGNILMNDMVRCHSTQGWLKNESNTLRVSVTSSVTTYSDEVLLAFNSAAIGGSDKIFSFYEEAPSLYLPVENDNYSIRFLNEAGSNPVIPVSLRAGKDGNYTIQITGTEGFTNVYLQDLKTGAMQDVKAQPAYTFVSSTADDVNRFLVRFTTLGIDQKQSEQNIFVFNNVLNINDPGKAVITVYNLTGMKMLEKQTNNEPVFRLPLQFPTGYYLVKMTSGKSIWSEKVFVK